MSSRIALATVLWLAIGITTLQAELFRKKKSGKATSGGEYIIVSGGPALRSWELLREDDDEPHDLWWGNFIRSARFRIAELIRRDANVNITWLVYRPGYVTRGREDQTRHLLPDGRSRIDDIISVPQMFGRDYNHLVRLRWFDDSQELIDYLNKRERSKKISGFEYFGHSNSRAFMFDYSNHILGASRSWLHVSELDQLKRKAFARDAFCKSWGCYSGQIFSRAFHKATGVPMWGATGKTDYSVLKDDRLPVVIEGTWVAP